MLHHPQSYFTVNNTVKFCFIPIQNVRLKFAPIDAGKLAAQCSHAAVECFRQGMKKSPEITNAWVLGGEPKIVLRSDSPGEDNLKKLAQSASKVGLVAAIIRYRLQ